MLRVVTSNVVMVSLGFFIVMPSDLVLTVVMPIVVAPERTFYSEIN